MKQHVTSGGPAGRAYISYIIVRVRSRTLHAPK